MNIKNVVHQDSSDLFQSDPLSSFKDIVRMQIRRQLSRTDDDSFNNGRITEFSLHSTRPKNRDGKVINYNDSSSTLGISLKDKIKNQMVSEDVKNNEGCCTDCCVTNLQPFSSPAKTIPLSSCRHRNVPNKDANTVVSLVQHSDKGRDLNEQEQTDSFFQSEKRSPKKVDLSDKLQTFSSELFSVPRQNTESFIEPLLDNRRSPYNTQLISSTSQSFRRETECDPPHNSKSVPPYLSSSQKLEISSKALIVKKNTKVTKCNKNIRHDEDSLATDSEETVTEKSECLQIVPPLYTSPAQAPPRRRCTPTCVLCHIIIILTLFFSFLAKFASEILPEFSLSCGHLETYWSAFVELILNYIEQFSQMSYLNGPPPL